MIYMGTDTWMTSPKTCFSLLVFNMARGFENVCESMFCDVKASKKGTGAIYKETTRWKEFLGTWKSLLLKMPKMEETHNSCHRVSLHDERLAVLKLFSRLFCFEQNSGETVYTDNQFFVFTTIWRHLWSITEQTQHGIYSERFESRNHFKSRVSLIVRVNVVLCRTVVVNSDWRFDNQCRGGSSIFF